MVGQPVQIDPAWHYPISLGLYHRMIDAGVLGEDDHVELLEGVIVAMSPQDKAHAFSVAELVEQLARQLPAHLRLRAQLPLTLARSEPEPDLAVVEKTRERQAARHPDHALLVIEVAGTSLPKDRRGKTGIYAKAGIDEYWLVDLAGRAVDVFREPDVAAGTYRLSTRVESDGRVECASIPGVAVDVATLFL